MYKISDFRVGANSRGWAVIDKNGYYVRRFSAHLYTKREVELWREGFVRGLNYDKVLLTHGG